MSMVYAAAAARAPPLQPEVAGPYQSDQSYTSTAATAAATTAAWTDSSMD